MDAGIQDGKDADEKEVKMYKNIYEYLTKVCGASKADKSVLQSMLKNS